MSSSDDHETRIPDAQPPRRTTPLHITAPSARAGGLQAVRSSFRFTSDAGLGILEAGRLLSKMNQVDGFDCPGCAWPDPDGARSKVAEYCENGAKAFAEEATRRRADRALFAQRSVVELAELDDHDLGKLGRICEPMVLRKGASHYEPISYFAAFELVARALRESTDPNRAVFYTSGRTSNEAAFLYQLFVRAYGTNNLPDCSNMCHESSGVGLGETLGIGKGSVTLEDFEHADTIVVIGQNPGTNHPRMLTTLQEAKSRGAKIIAINPLKETGLLRFVHPQKPLELLRGGTDLADLYLQVRINGDVPLLKAILCKWLERERAHPGSVFDHHFLEEHTVGYEALVQHLERQDVDALVEASGVDASEVDAAAELLLRGPNTIVCWAMGLTQHENGVANIREVVNLLLLRGSIGKKGAGTCPVRGHSNVQGDRTMGIHERPEPAFLDALERVCGFSPPRDHGVSVVEAIEAMRRAEVDVFFAMGGNFLSATPDTERTAEGLRRCKLTVHVSTKVNRSHLVHGEEAIILPCLGRSERDEQPSGPQLVSVENSMGVVHQSHGERNPAAPGLMSEVRIVAGLAEATLGDVPVRFSELADDYDRIRALIERVIPGFERYNERVRQPGGFYLPNGARERRFDTDVGKARLTVNEAPDLTLPSGALRMMTIRSHDQYNTTIYGRADRYRGLSGDRRVVLMSERDMRERELSVGDIVDLTNDHGGIRRVAERFQVVPYDIPSGCVATYFPEANVLVPLEQRARDSLTPASKSVVVRVEVRERDRPDTA